MVLDRGYRIWNADQLSRRTYLMARFICRVGSGGKNEEYHAREMLATYICIWPLGSFMHRTTGGASQPNELFPLYLSRKRRQKRGSSFNGAKTLEPKQIQSPTCNKQCLTFNFFNALASL